MCDLDLFVPPGVMGMAAGVRIAFRSTTTTVQGAMLAAHDDRSAIDIAVDGAPVASCPTAGRDGFSFTALPPHDKLIEVWLPQFGLFPLVHLEIDDSATLEPYNDARPVWVTHGSSITHCRHALAPTKTRPAIVARQRGLNHRNLGLGGQCHLDPMVARLIRDLPADAISVCAGVNIQSSTSLSERTFLSSLVGFVQIIREKHARTPLALISPIATKPDREPARNLHGVTIGDFRAYVRTVFEILRDHGDRSIFLIEGPELLEPENADRLLGDGVHPTVEGYAHMADNFIGQADRLGLFRECPEGTE